MLFFISFIIWIKDNDDFPGLIPVLLFLLFILCLFTSTIKTVKTDITVAPFKDSTSVIIKYKDEVIIKTDYKLYILDSIKIVYIEEYGFLGKLDSEIKLNNCYDID